MKKNSIYTIFMICLFAAISFSQPIYYWELKQAGSSIGGPIDVYKFNTDIVYYGSNNKIYKSTDRGETFTQTGTNVPNASKIKAVILDDFNSGTFLVAIEHIGSNDKIYKTTDDGQTWMLKLNEGQMSFFGIPMEQDPSHPDTIYTMVDNNFKRSTNFGDTWITIASNFGPVSAPCDIAVFPDTSIILIGDNTTGIFRSLNRGKTWTAVLNTSGEIPTISVDYTNPGTAWATKWAGGGGFLKSTDYGENWTLVPGFNGEDMWGVHVQLHDSNLVMNACYSCGNAWRSVNGGSTWTQISIASQNYQIFIVDSITQFAAQGNGFYKLNSDLFIPVELTSFTAETSENEISLNWTTATELNNQGFEIERSTDNQTFEKIGFIPGFGTTTESKSYTYKIIEFASGTQYYRLKQIDFDGTYEYSDAIEVEGLTPTQYVLFQNYPNPFNPSTSIKFSIPIDSNVKLKLFNLLGQEVAELLNSEISVGIHHIDFNASRLSSGTYFYVLEANGNNGSNFTATKKMILTK
ncbi:MAG: T9SS type A sorting domain-containing protein [Bacteroidetes bacterium]|nr:T9SS type A sorting domain-containing protein [Bacteroidota bacterium]